VNAKKCDRCGQLYMPHTYANIGDAWRYSILRDNHPYEEDRLDLCNGCKVALEKWLKCEDSK